MNLFGLNKNKEIVDLGERYKRQQERTEKIRENALASAISPSEDSDSVDEKRKKLAKRLVDMTDKIEELTNQIYHLQQRIEVIEQKMRVGLSG